MLFRNNFFHKNTVGESKAPSLLQKEKRGSAKSDASKVLFPGIGNITNPKVGGGENLSKDNFFLFFQIFPTRNNFTKFIFTNGLF